MGADGKIAGRCRALEAVRIFYELDNQFMNVLSGRERIQMGISDSPKELPREPKLEQRPAGRLRPFADRDPVRPAEARYRDRFCSSFSLRKPRKIGENEG